MSEIKDAIETEEMQLVIDRTKSIEINGVVVPYTLIKELNINRKINEHSELVIKGNSLNFDISNKIENEIKIYSYQNVNSLIGTMRTDLLFAGIIESIEQNGVDGTEITITGKSYSIKLDREKRKRSFQDKNKSYKDIIETIKTEGKYDFNFVCSEKLEKQKEEKEIEIMIQYEETDWEFLKRVVSKKKEVILIEDGKTDTKEEKKSETDSKNETESKQKEKKWNIWFGMISNKGLINIEQIKRKKTVKNRKESYIYAEEIAMKYEIGDRVEYENKKYIITESKSECDIKNAVLHSYKLEEESSIKIVEKRNENIAGKSILAKVSEIGKGENLTRIRLDFIFENTTEKEKERAGWEKYWFRYSTPYSGTNSGMYIMPEKEDMVTVYFPNGYESNCYVGNSVREKNMLEEKDTDEAHKRIMIPTGQQVILSEKLNKVRILGNKDRSVYMDAASDHIELFAGDAKGVMNKDEIKFLIGSSTIISKKDSIVFSVGENSEIVIKGDKIAIKSGGSEITLGSGKVNVKGS